MAITAPAPPRRASVLDMERAALTIGLITVISAVAFESMAVATILPAASRQLGWPDLYGWAFSAFMLTSLVTTIAASQRADRRGPLAPFTAGILCFALGLVVAGLAPTMPLFILGRALQGCGAGAISSMAYVCVGRGYPDELRPRILALMSSAWVVPALAGPALAGLAAEQFSWRLVFIALLPILFLAGALMLPGLRGLAVTETAAPAPNNLSVALRLAVGAGLMLAGLDMRAPLPAAAITLAGLLLGWPALRRLMPAGTLTARPGLPAALAARGMLTFCFFGAEVFIPLALTSLRGESTVRAGVALTASALTWTTGAWLQARLDGRDGGAGRRQRVAAGLALILLGGAVMAAAVLIHAVLADIAVVGWGVAGLGIGITYPTISLIVLRLSPAGQEGEVAGALRVAEVLSVAVAAGLGGAAIALGRSMGWPGEAGIGAAFALAGAGGVLGLLAVMGVPGGAAALADAGARPAEALAAAG